MSDADHQQYMGRALALARRGLFTTDPNPRVGCVVVRDDAIVGEGWHRSAGEPHAEVNALDTARGHTENATVYVTLEPCCHHGRTPPCTQALVAARVAHVVVAMLDPNPEVHGAGVAALNAAGITTEVGVCESAAETLNPGFIKRMTTGRPLVRCKLAMSLDGRTAMASGESKWITGEAARRDVHKLRARSSAVLTGVGTVLADDPSLNVRGPLAETPALKQPTRVVLDPSARMPAAANMLALPGRTVVVTHGADAARSEALARAGAELVELPGNEQGIDLSALLGFLADDGVNELLVEAGATLAGAFVEAGLVDELVLYVAPLLLGDAARGLMHLPSVQRMQDRLEVHICEICAVGEDWRVTAEPRGTVY